jgi:serine phosphatase RsbU (regulator of sigma subunit)
MSRRARLTIAVLLSAIAIDVMGFYTFSRLRHWDSYGWAGLSYIPSFSAKAHLARTGPGGFRPGRVLIVFPGSASDRAGMTCDDTVVAINGLSILGNQDELTRLDERLRAGDVLHYTTTRNGKQRSIDVPLGSPLEVVPLLIQQGVSAIVAVLFMAIGFLVFTRRPEDRRATVFFVMVLFGALSLIGSISTSLDGSNARGIMMRPSSFVAVAGAIGVFSLGFLPLTLHLALVFPNDRPILKRHPIILRWIYGIPLLAATVAIGFAGLTVLLDQQKAYAAGFHAGRYLSTIGPLLAAAGLIVALRIVYLGRNGAVRSAFFQRPLQSLISILAIALALATLLGNSGHVGGMMIVLGLTAAVPFLIILIYPVVSCIALFRSYREAGPEEKRQVKWPLWGTMIALGSRIVFGGLAFFGGMSLAFGGHSARNWSMVLQILDLIPRLAYVLIPLSFAFAILKYRLMNIDVIIKKTVAYTILSTTIVLLYLGIVGGIGSLVVSMSGVRNQSLVIGATVMVALLFVPLRNRLQQMVDRNLFRQKYDYPQALQSLSEQTVTATDPVTYLESACETLQLALQNRAVIMLARRGGELVAVAKIGVADSVLGTLSVPIAAMPAGTLERPFDPRRRELPDEVGTAIRALDIRLAVPVRGSEEIQAMLLLAGKLSSAEFDVEDLDFLASAADQVGVALDRIRLSRDETDYSEARDIQRALLPSSMPALNGFEIAGMWEPALTVGGDYYDIIDHGDGRVSICIGDVAGKGMPAALLMSALQASVRSSAGDARGAADLCERVRRVIVSNLTGGRFVTFFYALLDTRSNELVYCNAGHNPPMLRRANGDVVRLENGGPAIARMMREAFVEGTVTIEPGDRLLLFTDGASEAKNATGEEYGESRLEAGLAIPELSSAPRLQSAIAAAVTAFAAGDLEDDLTIVTLTRPA